jgi:hypothetical protein
MPVAPPKGAAPSVPLSVHPTAGAAGVKGDSCCFSNGTSTSDVLLLMSLLSRCPNAPGINWTKRKSRTRKNALPPRGIMMLVVIRLFIRMVLFFISYLKFPVVLEFRESSAPF